MEVRWGPSSYTAVLLGLVLSVISAQSAPPTPPSSPPTPPSSPLIPRSLPSGSVVGVSTGTALADAVSDASVSVIILQATLFELPVELNITRNVSVSTQGDGTALFNTSGIVIDSVDVSFTGINITSSQISRWQGGGLSVSNGQLTMIRCHVYENGAISSGGGVAASGGTAVFIGCSFFDNHAHSGGSVKLAACAATFIDCSVHSSRTGPYGGAGLSLEFCAATLIRCSICSNERTWPWGFVGGDGGGGGIDAVDSVELFLIDCSIHNNSATHGAGVVASDSFLSMVSCRIYQNSASQVGGGLIAWDTRVLFSNGTIFTNNSAPDAGATMVLLNSAIVYLPPLPPGHFLFLSTCTANFIQCSLHCGECGSNLSLPPVVADSSCDVKPPSTVQSCPWNDALFGSLSFGSSILGKLLHADWTSQLQEAQVWPFPCSPGTVGSSGGDAGGQDSPLCAGLCPEGYYCPGAATLVPIPCPAGAYCSEGSTTYTACPEGTYSLFPGRHSIGQCQPCPPGAFCGAGSERPTACPPGQFNNLIRQGRCAECLAGKYSSDPGATRCQNCLSGFYSPNRFTCLPCPINEYCVENASIGATCPFDQSTTLGQARGLEDCICKETYYQRNLSCISCAETSPGLECSVAGVQLRALKLRAGYWRSRNTSEQILLCFTHGACIGSAGVNQHNTSNVCADGHEGPFCELCIPDYFKGVGGLCLECSGNTALAFALPIAASLVVVLGIAWFMYRYELARVEILESFHERAEQIETVVANPADALNSFIQAAQEEAEAVVGAELEAAFGMNTCQEGDAEGKQSMQGRSSGLRTGGGGTGFEPASAAAAADADIQNEDQVTRTEQRKQATLGQWGVAISFLIIFLSYPSTSQSIFFAFPCIPLDDGRRLLRSDLSIDCDSSEYWWFSAYSVIMIFIYPIGIPALFHLALHTHSNVLGELSLKEQELALKLKELKLDLNCSENIKDNELADEMQYMLQSLPIYIIKLVDGYRHELYWFELAECLRKLMIVGAPVFFDPPGSVGQLIYGLMVCFITFGLLTYARPYVHTMDNALLMLCQLQIFFALLASVIDSFDDAILRANHNMDILLVVLTILPLGIAVLTETDLPGLFAQSGLCKRPWCTDTAPEKDSPAAPVGSRDRRGYCSEFVRGVWGTSKPWGFRGDKSDGKQCQFWSSLYVKLRIIISFCQVLSSLGVVYNIPFPPIYSAMVHWLGSISIGLPDVLPLGCLFGLSFYAKLLIRTLVFLPFTFFATCSVYMDYRAAKAERRESPVIVHPSHPQASLSPATERIA